MPRLNLLTPLQNRGVDMKSNALLIGSTKLHAATNLMWDENVIRTRYEFEYIPLGPVGKFQGSSSFRPQMGLSYMPLSDKEAGLVSVVDGAVFWSSINSTCPAERISTQVFCDKGDVNVFQAEDWLIFQNISTSTYWWRGEGDITESPGNMGEEWSDRNMPETQFEPVAPVADIPTCELEDNQIQFIVVNHNTDEEIPGAYVKVVRNTGIVKQGTTNSIGSVIFKLTDGKYTYSASKEGFQPKENIEFTMVGSPTIYIRLQPLSFFVGLNIKLQYIQDADLCESGHVCDAAIFNIYGNDVFIGKANLNNLSNGGTRIASFDLTDTQAEEIAEGSVDGETISFRFECATDDPLFDPFAWSGGCHPGIGQLVITDQNGGELYNGCPAGTTIDIDVNPAP